jgi:6-phosphogluconolactonase
VPAEVKVVPDSTELNREAAREFQRAAQAAIADHGRFAVALSGGNTPRAVYSLLAEQHSADLPWDRVHVFFGDERYVPADHPESNYRMAREALLSRAPIPQENVHRFRTELDPESAARDYETQLQTFFRVSDQSVPRFDLIMLGLGDDGHTASLFPGTSGLAETRRLVAAVWVEKFKTYRLTLTFPVLNRSAEVLFLVAGKGKARVLRDVQSTSAASLLPAQRVQPTDGRLLWLVDQDAASLLQVKTQA